MRGDEAAVLESVGEVFEGVEVDSAAVLELFYAKDAAVDAM